MSHDELVALKHMRLSKYDGTSIAAFIDIYFCEIAVSWVWFSLDEFPEA